jgi:hypothetical protein
MTAHRSINIVPLIENFKSVLGREDESPILQADNRKVFNHLGTFATVPIVFNIFYLGEEVLILFYRLESNHIEEIEANGIICHQTNVDCERV